MLRYGLKDILSFPKLALPPEAKVHIRDQLALHNLSLNITEVTTEDGYINELWNVKSMNSSIWKNNSDPIFFQHGVIDKGDSWFTNSPDKAPGYVLALQGYDIWIGNNRGTTNSWKHKTLNVNDKAYWNFTFNEMGIYDQPTF